MGLVFQRYDFTIFITCLVDKLKPKDAHIIDKLLKDFITKPANGR